jgi:Raf kinase inhibitor-like YbhB/YbcL family protein
MQLTTTSFREGQPIPGEFAFAIADATAHLRHSSNRNPQLSWTDAPSGTQSFVLICHDPDVPSRGDDVNQEGRSVPYELARVDFYHWLLVDIPASMHSIAAGEYSDRVTARGKAGPQAAHGTRQGLNDYTGWFANDAQMKGDYYGYDGPCPPWNDERIHRYIFTLYALATPRCAVEGSFDGAQLLQRIQKDVLAQAKISGTYTLSPQAR